MSTKIRTYIRVEFTQHFTLSLRYILYGGKDVSMGRGVPLILFHAQERM